MPIIQDAIGKDGILKAILTRNVNGVPTVLYPHTSADVVDYAETSVEVTLDKLKETNEALSILAKNTAAELRNLNGDAYHKEYIDNIINELLDKILEIKLAITNMAIAIHSIEVYQKPDIDQKLNEIIAAIASINTILTEKLATLTQYITIEYDDIPKIDEKIANCLKTITDFKDEINTRFSDFILQSKAEYGDFFRERFEAFYKKEEVDAIIREYYDKVSTIRGDYTEMDKKAVSDMNAYMQSTKKNLEASHQNQIDVLQVQLIDKMTEGNDGIKLAIRALSNQIANLQTSSNMELSSLPLADEEMF